MRMIIVGLLGLVFVGSTGARIATYDGSSAAPKDGAGPLAPQALVDSGSASDAAEGASATAADDEAKPLESWLPILTQASFFGLLGFAIGYFGRKVLKIAMIVVAVVALGVLGLDKMGAFPGGVDWQSIIDFFNRIILNLKENTPITQFLTERIPAAAGFLGGILLGFRSG